MSSIRITGAIEEALSKSPNWIRSLNGDPRTNLINCEESFTRYRTLVDLLSIPKTDTIVQDQRELVLADERVKLLINNLPSDWSNYLVKGHQKVDYPPSVLLLLFDFGVKPNDNSHIENILNQMRTLQDEEGRFLSLAKFPTKQPAVGSSLCDTHIITEVLQRGGYSDTTEVRKALSFVSDQLKTTNQGIAWKCEPNSASRARGPGRKEDICPQVTLEALRLFSLIPEDKRPKELITAGKSLLSCWDRRKESRPYLFGHGSRFKKLRPPFFWYNIGEVLDTMSQYQILTKEDSFKEMLSLVVSKADNAGQFTPESIYRDFKNWSFGQKNEWSPWTTLYICRILQRVYG